MTLKELDKNIIMTSWHTVNAAYSVAQQGSETPSLLWRRNHAQAFIYRETLQAKLLSSHFQVLGLFALVKYKLSPGNKLIS